MVLEPDTGLRASDEANPQEVDTRWFASKDAESQRGVDCEIPHQGRWPQRGVDCEISHQGR